MGEIALLHLSSLNLETGLLTFDRPKSHLKEQRLELSECLAELASLTQIIACQAEHALHQPEQFRALAEQSGILCQPESRQRGATVRPFGGGQRVGKVEK